MQQSRYRKAYCIAPYFSKEAGSPGWFAVVLIHEQFLCQRRFTGETPLRESFWSILREGVFFSVQFLDRSVQKSRVSEVLDIRRFFKYTEQ